MATNDPSEVKLNMPEKTTGFEHYTIENGKDLQGAQGPGVPGASYNSFFQSLFAIPFKSSMPGAF